MRVKPKKRYVSVMTKLLRHRPMLFANAGLHDRLAREIARMLRVHVAAQRTALIARLVGIQHVDIAGFTKNAGKPAELSGSPWRIASRSASRSFSTTSHETILVSWDVTGLNT
jgi:hypothetical protein